MMMNGIGSESGGMMHHHQHHSGGNVLVADGGKHLAYHHQQQQQQQMVGGHKRPRVSSRDDPFMEFDFLGDLPSDGLNGFDGFSFTGAGTAELTGDVLTMTTPDHCLVMAQRLENMAQKDECCDMELILTNFNGSKRSKAQNPPIPLHSPYACAASPLLRSLVMQRNHINGVNTGSSSRLAMLKEASSPSSHSLSGETDAYESGGSTIHDGVLPPTSSAAANIKAEMNNKGNSGSSSKNSSSSSSSTSSSSSKTKDATAKTTTSSSTATTSSAPAGTGVNETSNDNSNTIRTSHKPAILKKLKMENGMYRLSVVLPSTLNIEHDALTAVRAYMYTGILQCPRVLLFDILQCAFYLDMQGLVNLAQDYLQCNIDSENAFQVLNAGVSYKLLSLEDTALEFICSHFDIMVERPEWKEVSQEAIELILCRDNIQTKAEIMIFRALCTWTMEDKGDREVPFLQMAQDVRMLRLSNMTRDELIEMSQHELVSGSKELRKALYDEALQRVEQGGNGPNANAAGAGGNGPKSPSSRVVSRPRIYGGIVPTSREDALQALPPLIVNQCERTIVDHDRAVCALTQVDGYIIAAGGDYNIRAYNAQTFQLEHVMSGHQAAIVALKSHQDKLISTSPDKTIRIWSTTTWACIAVLPTPKSSACSLAIFDDKLITGSDDGYLKSWGMGGWSLQRTAVAHQHVIWALARYGRNTLISGSSDTFIKVWTVNRLGFNLVTTLTGHKDEVQALAVDEEKHWLLSGSDDGAILIHDCKTWACIMQLGWRNSAVLALVCYKDKIIAGLGNGAVNIWNRDELPERSECAVSLTEHKSCVMAILVTNGKLITASYDRTMKIWGP